MSVINTALHGVHAAAINLSSLLAVETDTEFNEDKVTPGAEGFIATAVFALAVLLLGFLLVRRIRRNNFRAEAREVIAAELAERDGGAAPADSAIPASSADPAGPAGPAVSADPADPASPDEAESPGTTGPTKS